MPRSPSIWLVFLLVLTTSVVASPEMYPIPGLPEGQLRCWTAEESAGGWIVGTSQGVLIQERGAWSLFRPPKLGDAFATIPYASGMVVGGPGYCYTYSNRSWTEQNLNDQIVTGISVSGQALLAGRNGLYLVDQTGELKLLRKYNGSVYVKIFKIRSQVFITSATEEPLMWDGAGVVNAPPDMHWASHHLVGSVQQLEDGRLFVTTEKGFSVVDHGEPSELVPEIAQESVSQGLISAYLIGTKVVVATYTKGVRVYSAETERLEWTAPVSETGNVYFSRPHADGFLFGTSNGLYVFSNPSRFDRVSFPRSDIAFVEGSTEHLVVGSANGVYDERGEKLVAPIDYLRSFSRVGDGRPLWGGIGRIAVGADIIKFGDSQVLGVAELSSGKIAAVQPQDLFLVDLAQPTEPISIPLTPAFGSSVARTSKNECIVGTNLGVSIFDTKGAKTAHWGAGLMRVRQAGNAVVVLGQHGDVYSEAGKVIAQLPADEILDVDQWKDALWFILRFPDQSVWTGRLDPVSKKWVPYDIPQGSISLRLRSVGEKLYLIGPGSILAVTDAKPLDVPGVDFDLGRESRLPVPMGSRTVPSNVDTLTALLPAARLGPWMNPSYRVKVNDEKWDDAVLGSQTRELRIPWGKSKITVEANWAGIESFNTTSVFREWPWWARWPAWIGYLAFGATLLYGATALRTRQLQQRATHLELQVEERTIELKNAQRAREDFFSTVSHEIRNPLNGVVGICDILAHTANDDDMRRARRHVRTLKSCAEQLRSILDDVLDFSRIDRGEIMINEEDFELRAAAEGAARSIDPGLDKTRMELPEEEVWVLGDQGKIRQIITNLVTNALKYGVPSAAQLFLLLDAKADSSIDFSIIVRNTGVTIGPDELARIFTGFVRGEDALRRKIPGTGLGLAVSRRMAEAMGGTLEATSQDGLTEFRLRLQLTRGQAQSEIISDGVIPQIKSRALAIEDEEYNRTVLGFHLGQLGYEVDWAKDGASAMQCAQQSSYDLILTDFVLPDTTGDVLARKMLAVMKEPKPPIIAVTAYSTPDKIAQAKAAGITGFVTKPVSAKKLRDAILNATSRFAVQSQAPAQPLIDCDFTVFSKINDSRKLLAEYADAIGMDWSAIVEACRKHIADAELRRAIHSFKGRVLVIHAVEVAEQLGLLEVAIDEERHEDAERLVAVIYPMIAHLAQRAREAAFA